MAPSSHPTHHIPTSTERLEQMANGQELRQRLSSARREAEQAQGANRTLLRKYADLSTRHVALSARSEELTAEVRLLRQENTELRREAQNRSWDAIEGGVSHD